MSRLQVQAGPGRPGRQGSLQSLFWFPGRNKARSNVLWRARTSTGPPGGGGGGGGGVVWLQLPVMTPLASLHGVQGAGGGGAG